MTKLSPSSVASSPATSSTGSTCSTSSSSSSSKSSNRITKSSSSNIDKRKRLAANARERKRMHLLNKAYDQLRARLKDAENKSKYDVLVQAKEYIQALATICEKFDKQDSTKHDNYAVESTLPIHIQSNSPVDMSLYQYDAVCSPYSTISNHSQMSCSTSTHSIQSPSPISIKTPTTIEQSPQVYTSLLKYT